MSFRFFQSERFAPRNNLDTLIKLYHSLIPKGGHDILNYEPSDRDRLTCSEWVEKCIWEHLATKYQAKYKEMPSDELKTAFIKWAEEYFKKKR